MNQVELQSDWSDAMLYREVVERRTDKSRRWDRHTATTAAVHGIH